MLKRKKRFLSIFIINDIEISSDSDRENSEEEKSDEENSNEETSDEENSNEENSKKKIKEILI